MENPGFEQVEIWPALRDLPVPNAHMHMEPDDLTRDYGITFTRDFDDPDYFVGAVLRAPSGRLIGLRRYRGARPGTEVLTDANDDQVAAREELLQMLHLSPDVFAWINPEWPGTDDTPSTRPR